MGVMLGLGKAVRTPGSLLMEILSRDSGDNDARTEVQELWWVDSLSFSNITKSIYHLQSMEIPPSSQTFIQPPKGEQLVAGKAGATFLPGGAWAITVVKNIYTQKKNK